MLLTFRDFKKTVAQDFRSLVSFHQPGTLIYEDISNISVESNVPSYPT
jgi:hypothetical protein